MGYALTIRAVKRVEEYLRALTIAKATLEWKVPEPKKLAYRIQEALASARELHIEPYASLRDAWIIKWKGETVIAEYALGQLTMPSNLVFHNLTDALDIIETVIRHKNVTFDLLFPNAQPDETISTYCENSGYVVSHNEHGLLIKYANPQPT